MSTASRLRRMCSPRWRATRSRSMDDSTLVSPPRYAELALGMPAKEALAALPLDLIGFAEDNDAHKDIGQDAR